MSERGRSAGKKRISGGILPVLLVALMWAPTSMVAAEEAPMREKPAVESGAARGGNLGTKDSVGSMSAGAAESHKRVVPSSDVFAEIPYVYPLMRMRPVPMRSMP